MSANSYSKANNYPDLNLVYAQCDGPDGVKLAEYVAEKMGLQSGKRIDEEQLWETIGNR